MKFSCTLALIIVYSAGFSQIKFPKDFNLVKGENGSGLDDYFTNGKYSFNTRNLFADHDFKSYSDSVREFISLAYNFPFKITKDGFYWGTGLQDGFYLYVIVTPPYGVVFELSSKNNDKGFSQYSKWLLSTLREYRRKGNDYSFPVAIHSD